MNASYRSIGAALCLTSLALAPQAFAAELTLPRDGWTTWQVAAVDSAPDWCCWASGRDHRNAPRAACKLDGKQEGYGNRNDETTDAIRVYVRTSGGKIDRLRALSATCPVETATQFNDLGTVAEQDSARWLTGMVKQQDEDALAALAMNRGNVARDAMTGFARNDAREETRKHAVFWLSQVRGAEGADITSSVMFNDKDPDVREHASFALSQSDAPRVVPDLIRLGQTDRSAEVRGQAWFWLAQTEAPGAESAIGAALRKETDEDVLERAILALSQLPDERATRALIAAAEDKSLSREMRKQAVFWLVQSETDGALEYLERVLAVHR
jgi:HEAT repeat protein